MSALIFGTFLLTCFAMVPSSRADVPVLIFAGQSNMTGYATDTRLLKPEELAEQPNVLFYGDNGFTWKTVNLGLRPTQPPNVSAAGFGFCAEGTVGNDLVKAGVFPKVLEIKYVMNGSPFDSYLVSPDDAAKNKGGHPVNTSWAPDFTATGTQFSLYKGMLDRIKDARAAYTAETGEKTYIAGFFWMQGEADAYGSPEIAKLYDRNLKTFITALRRDLDSPDMPFIYGRIALAFGATSEALVRSAQDNVANPDHPLFVANVFKVDTDAFDRAGDKCHLTTAGALSLGHAMAEGYEKIAPKK